VAVARAFIDHLFSPKGAERFRASGWLMAER
jgi:hypothetical protein